MVQEGIKGSKADYLTKKTFVTPAQLAQMMGCSTNTVLRNIHAGSIKAHKLGPKTFRIDLDDALGL